MLYIGTPEKCRELLGQLNAGELTEGQVKELYAKAQEQPETGRDDTFSIYQLKDGDETRDYRFEPYDRLQAAGLAVDRANYELVYTAPLAPGTSLDDIFTRFNIDHPKDFKGHSLSVSDVVVLHQDGQDTAHYVDRGDFKQIPEFLQEKQPQRENPLKAAEQTTEQTLQSAKITTLPKIHIQFCRTFSFVLFFDFRYFFRGGCYNPKPRIAYPVEQRVKLPPLRVLFGGLI